MRDRAYGRWESCSSELLNFDGCSRLPARRCSRVYRSARMKNARWNGTRGGGSGCFDENERIRAGIWGAFARALARSLAAVVGDALLTNARVKIYIRVSNRGKRFASCCRSSRSDARLFSVRPNRLQSTGNFIRYRVASLWN